MVQSPLFAVLQPGSTSALELNGLFDCPRDHFGEEKVVVALRSLGNLKSESSPHLPSPLESTGFQPTHIMVIRLRWMERIMLCLPSA